MFLDDRIARDCELRHLWRCRSGAIPAYHLPPVVPRHLHVCHPTGCDQLLSGARDSQPAGRAWLDAADSVAFSVDRRPLSRGLPAILAIRSEALHLHGQLTASTALTPLVTPPNTY